MVEVVSRDELDRAPDRLLPPLRVHPVALRPHAPRRLRQDLEIGRARHADLLQKALRVPAPVPEPVHPSRLIVALDRRSRLRQGHPVAVAVDDLRVVQVAQDLDDAPLARRGTAAHLARAESGDGARELGRARLHERDGLASRAEGVDLPDVGADLGADDDSFRLAARAWGTFHKRSPPWEGFRLPSFVEDGW